MPDVISIRSKAFWWSIAIWMIASPTAMAFLFYKVGEGWTPW